MSARRLHLILHAPASLALTRILLSSLPPWLYVPPPLQSCGGVAEAVTASSEVRYLYDQLLVKEEGITTETLEPGCRVLEGIGPQDLLCFLPLDPVIACHGLTSVVGSQHWGLHYPQHFADSAASPTQGHRFPPCRMWMPGNYCAGEAENV